MDKYFLITHFKYDGPMFVTHDSEPHIFEFENIEELNKHRTELKNKGWIIKKIIKGKEIKLS